MSLKMLFQSENKRQNADVCLMVLLLSLFLNVTMTPLDTVLGFYHRHCGIQYGMIELPPQELSVRVSALTFQSLHPQPELTVSLVLL